MKTINIIRKKRVVNQKGETTFKREFLKCKINSAIPPTHNMIVWDAVNIN